MRRILMLLLTCSAKRYRSCFGLVRIFSPYFRAECQFQMKWEENTGTDLGNNQIALNLQI